MKELKISLDIYVEILEDESQDDVLDRITKLLDEQKGVSCQIYKVVEQEV